MVLALVKKNVRAYDKHCIKPVDFLRLCYFNNLDMLPIKQHVTFFHFKNSY